MRKRTTLGAVLAATAALLAAGPATAGVIDSAVPSISASGSTRVMYLAPGVIKNNGIETAFLCTSLDSSTVTIAIEVFAPEGGGALNDVSTGVSNGAMAVAPGASATISTGTSAGLHENLTITGLGNVKNGSARILSTSTRIMCTGLLVEKLGTTPNTIATMKLITRSKQIGD